MTPQEFYQKSDLDIDTRKEIFVFAERYHEALIKAGNLPISDVSDLLPYLNEIKERIVYRLQQEFPNAHDLVKSIVEDQFENIDNKVVGNSR